MTLIMRRIKLVLAVAAATASLLVASSPAHAVIAIIAEGLETADSVGNPNDRAFEATRDAANIGNPDTMPGYGQQTAQSAQQKVSE